MRIAIDGTAPAIGGGLTYLRELTPALCASSAGDDFYLFLRSDRENLQFELPPNCERFIISLPKIGRAVWRLAWQQVVFPAVLWRLRADVILCPYGIAPLFAPCAVVLGIQNASPYGGPGPGEWSRRVRNLALILLTRLSARRAGKVFYVSEWSREAISRSLGLPIGKTSIVYLGVSHRFRPAKHQQPQENDARRPYVLVVGSVSSYKDYVTLLRAWKLIDVSCDGRYDLMIVGPILERTYSRMLNSLVAQLALRNRVFFLPEASSEQLVALYQMAIALVMASYVETFGLPMLEAMSCGTPVVASDIPVTHEICGEAARYYRLGDPGDLAEKLLPLLTDAGARSNLARAGVERARDFTWRRAAECTMRLLTTSETGTDRLPETFDESER